MANPELSNGRFRSSSVFSILNFLCFLLFISFSIEISLANVADPRPNIFLPSDQSDDDLLALTRRTCTLVNPALNYRPVIGILSHPGDGASGRLSNATTASYIPASYVKFVESAGARVIPLIYNEAPEILQEKLDLVNGVILTSGRVREGLYFSVAEHIFKKVLERNDAGDNVPLYGIALGFQIISTIVGKDNSIIESFNATRKPSTLHFNEDVSLYGTVFQGVPAYLRKRVTRDCIVWHDHKYGISPKTFEGNQNLYDFFNILTTSTDENHKVYVSTASAQNYPITGFQWSPEKPAFEWGISTIPHTEYAIDLSQLVANHLIREARKSINHPPAQKVLDNLIYNYSPIYSGKEGKGYDEVYIFE